MAHVTFYPVTRGGSPSRVGSCGCLNENIVDTRGILLAVAFHVLLGIGKEEKGKLQNMIPDLF